MSKEPVISDTAKEIIRNKVMERQKEEKLKGTFIAQRLGFRTEYISLLRQGKLNQVPDLAYQKILAWINSGEKFEKFIGGGSALDNQNPGKKEPREVDSTNYAKKDHPINTPSFDLEYYQAIVEAARQAGKANIEVDIDIKIRINGKEIQI